MESKVAQKCKIDNEYSNINNLSIMFKITMMIITEVWKWDGTTNLYIFKQY